VLSIECHFLMGILYSPIPLVADVLTLKSSIRNVLGFFFERGCTMKFPIGTGRLQTIARNDKICTLCRGNIGDEFPRP
jgi:hypothetical protein